MIAGVANGGIIPTPHVLGEVFDANGRVVQTNEPGEWRMSMRSDNAAALVDALVIAGESGGGNTAAVPGLVVGVKTGTAQHGTDPPVSNAWIVGFAGLPDEDPELAVVVLVEDLPDPGDQTGGRDRRPDRPALVRGVLRRPTLMWVGEASPRPMGHSNPPEPNIDPLDCDAPFPLVRGLARAAQPKECVGPRRTSRRGE